VWTLTIAVHDRVDIAAMFREIGDEGQGTASHHAPRSAAPVLDIVAVA